MKLVCALPPYTSFCRHCRHIRSNILCCSEPSTTGNLYTRVKSHCVPITRYYVNLTRRYVRYINSRELYSRIARTSRRSFLTSDVQAFEKTMAGLTLALRELIRTFLTRLTALVVSACAIVITSCCHSLPLDTGEFCFRVAVRLERVTSHPERSSAVVEHRVVYPTYAYTPAGICGPCV